MKLNNNFSMVSVNAEKADVVALVVSAFRLDMALIVDEAAKSRKETRLADEKGVLSETKKAAIREELEELKAEIKAEKSALKKVESVRKSVVSELVESGADKTCVENLFRVLACYNNESLCKYALKGVCTSWTDELDKAMNVAHSLKFSDKTGARVMGKAEKSAYETAKNIIKASVRGVCAVPENAYFGKVSVNMNGTDLGALHESFVTKVGLKYNTDKKTGEVTIAGDDIRTCVRKPRGKNSKIDASGFWAVAVDRIIMHICK